MLIVSITLIPLSERQLRRASGKTCGFATLKRVFGIVGMNAPGIGVIGSARLAQTLASFGFRTPHANVENAAVIAQDDSLLSMVVVETGRSGEGAWAEAQTLSNRTVIAIARAHDSDFALSTPGSTLLAGAVTVDQVLATLGYAQPGGEVGQQVIEPDPMPAALPLPLPLPGIPVQAPLPLPHHVSDPVHEQPSSPRPQTTPSQQAPSWLPPQTSLAQPLLPTPQAPILPPHPATAPPTQPSDLLHGRPRSFLPERSDAATDLGFDNLLRENVVLVVFAGKGGVTKTSTSVQLAEYAAHTLEGIGKVLLIDGNRGQPDIARRFRVSRPDLGFPTIWDAQITNNPANAVISADHINAARHRSLPRVATDLVLAPTAEQATSVSAETYSMVIDWAKTRYQIVVIDTQTKDSDSSDLWDYTFAPLLQSGQWGIGISAADNDSQANLITQLKQIFPFETTGRMLFLHTLQDPAQPVGVDPEFEQYTHRYGRDVGSTFADADYEAKINDDGIIDREHPAIRDATRRILHDVSGLNCFAPIVQQPIKRRWRFGR